MPEIIEAGETPQDKRKRKIEEVRSIFQEVRESEMSAMREEFAGIIAEASRKPEQKPAETNVEKALERETVGSETRTESADFGYGEVRPMIDMRYEQLPERMRKVRNPKGDAEIGRFMRALVGNDQATLNEMRAVARVQYEQTHKRAIEAISLANDAASIMPIPMASAIIAQMNATAVMRNICTVVQSPNNQYRQPVFGKATAGMVAEGSINTAAATGPEPGNVLLTKYKNQWVGTATEESVADSDFNLASALTEAAGNAIGYTEDVQACTSEGTAPDFTGSIVTGVTDVTEQTDGTLSFASFNKLYFAVPKPYRSNAVIMGGSVVMQLLTSLADAAGNRVMTPITQGAQPISDTPNAMGAIYGTRVYEVPLAAGTLLIGDPRKYIMLQNPVLTIKQSDVAGWSEDTIHFKVTLREDGVLAFADAFRLQLSLTTI